MSCQCPRADYAEGPCPHCDIPDETPTQVLESARIDWRRDWDAVLFGFVLGVLVTWIVK